MGYEAVYESITDEEEASSRSSGFAFRYVQLINAGQKVVASRCNGYVMGQLMPVLYNIHLGERKVSIVLAGESENDKLGWRGGDSHLSDSGVQYSKAVCRLIKERETSGPAAQVWTGTLRRYSQTAEQLGDRQVVKVKVLDELCFGSLEGLQCGRLRDSYPHEHERRMADRLNYRYPGAGGESYMDMIIRLRDCVQAMERGRGNAIIVCDMAVARALLGYFQGIPNHSIPDLEVNPGLIELTRSHSGFEVSTIPVEYGRVSFLARTATKEVDV